MLRESKDECKELHTLEKMYEAACEEHEEVVKELEKTSRHMHSMFQDQIWRDKVINQSALCFTAVIVVVFGIIIILFAYCLEDKVNHNVKQCTRTVMNIAVEFYGM